MVEEWNVSSVNPLLWEKGTVREDKGISFGTGFVPHMDLKKNPRLSDW